MQNTYEALKARSACIAPVTTSVSAKKEAESNPSLSGTTSPPLCRSRLAALFVRPLTSLLLEQEAVASRLRWKPNGLWFLMQRSCVDVEGIPTDTDTIAKESMYCKVKL